ncbi:MAG: circadian clock KaiB family protein [Halofilum sp. (in: g-proteobacteria)]|nr:circadian clock KaiB family protein [Halofilum sp. (in: g-proteobacteria)]
MNAKHARSETAVPALTLFVTGDAPRSRRARANLADALKAMGQESVTRREVDLLAHPEQTVTYSVFATPALLRTSPTGEMSVLYGDLSEQDKLRHFLADIEPASG